MLHNVIFLCFLPQDCNNFWTRFILWLPLGVPALRLGTTALQKRWHDMTTTLHQRERIVFDIKTDFFGGGICICSTKVHIPKWNEQFQEKQGNKHDKRSSVFDTTRTRGRDPLCKFNKDAVIVSYPNTIMNFLTARKIIASCNGVSMLCINVCVESPNWLMGGFQP